MMEPNRVRMYDQDYGTPGGVYLCQVNESVSCAACCGLYNVADTDKAHITALLAKRTLLFSETPRSIAGIDGFARQILIFEPQRRPYNDFHHCPFIGFIGKDKVRVGCLLHPMASGNKGVDYRGMSYYGNMACRTYFCPTHHHLPAVYKDILRRAVNDWYLYGLIVTEKNLLEALFGLIENRLQQNLSLSLFHNNRGAMAKLVDLLALKCNWPYRPGNADTLCHNFFTGNHSFRAAPDYVALGEPPSTYDTIFAELGSAFHNSAQLRHAEQLVETLVQAVVDALPAG